jgi:hypothetical protein
VVFGDVDLPKEEIDPLKWTCTAPFTPHLVNNPPPTSVCCPKRGNCIQVPESWCGMHQHPGLPAGCIVKCFDTKEECVQDDCCAKEDNGEAPEHESPPPPPPPPNVPTACVANETLNYRQDWIVKIWRERSNFPGMDWGNTPGGWMVGRFQTTIDTFATAKFISNRGFVPAATLPPEGAEVQQFKPPNVLGLYTDSYEDHIEPFTGNPQDTFPWGNPATGAKRTLTIKFHVEGILNMEMCRCKDLASCDQDFEWDLTWPAPGESPTNMMRQYKHEEYLWNTEYAVMWGGTHAEFTPQWQFNLWYFTSDGTLDETLQSSMWNPGSGHSPGTTWQGAVGEGAGEPFTEAELEHIWPCVKHPVARERGFGLILNTVNHPWGLWWGHIRQGIDNGDPITLFDGLEGITKRMNEEEELSCCMDEPFDGDLGITIRNPTATIFGGEIDPETGLPVNKWLWEGWEYFKRGMGDYKCPPGWAGSWPGVWQPNHWGPEEPFANA